METVPRPLLADGGFGTRVDGVARPSGVAWHHPPCRVHTPHDQPEPVAPATSPARPIAGWLFPVFFLSGAAALVYQIVWQRALFAIYGVDTISVTIVVTAFMLGLGLGSLAGGVVSRRHPRAAVALFAGTELGIGLYGAVSLPIFAVVAESTRGIGHAAAGVLAFLLVVFPALLMGASLPLLVGHAAPRTHNMGRTIGDLYCVNTLGAACGAFLAAYFLLGALGLRATTEVTAVCSCGLGLVVLMLSRRRGGEK